MTMTTTSEAFISVLIYISTVITTLRAGSRVIYMMKHDGAIGIIDGPLILGPHDILKMNKNSGKTSLEISPLWEQTHSFKNAVHLSLLGTSLSTGEPANDVTVGNIENENMNRRYYSLASPHKSFPLVQNSLLEVYANSSEQLTHEIEQRNESLPRITYLKNALRHFQSLLFFS